MEEIVSVLYKGKSTCTYDKSIVFM